MIVYDLCCDAGHRFEGWFASSEDFAGQQARGLVTCPGCGSARIVKAPMAPAVPRKGNRGAAARSEGAPAPVAGGSPPPEVAHALQKLAEIQAEALKSSKWVGEKFAEESRAIHYGEREAETIHGKATPKQAKELLDEGIKVSPLPFPVAPPDELN
jgi:hypothetical protein